MTQQKEIKLIAVDVDGTLLNSQSELSERSEAALRKAMAQGLKIVLATGKTRNSPCASLKLALDTPGIYLRGWQFTKAAAPSDGSKPSIRR
jgi:predicted mannosyl-3-phosphoglycerate phosphatase (HAD superfamily)